MISVDDFDECSHLFSLHFEVSLFKNYEPDEPDAVKCRALHCALGARRSPHIAVRPFGGINKPKTKVEQSASRNYITHFSIKNVCKK